MFLSRTTRSISKCSYTSIPSFQWGGRSSRYYSTPKSDNFVRIIEVGPRDGLQNEQRPISPAIKADLIKRLGKAGMRDMEVGSFVSPKWVPQMAGTAEVVSLIDPIPGANSCALVLNRKGLDGVVRALEAAASAGRPRPITEIAVVLSPTDAFERANANATVAESLARTESLIRDALAEGLQVRGYSSLIITCPYSGRVDPRRVRNITKELFEMGCYEVSLADTTGTGTPASVRAVIEEVCKDADPSKLAGHFHDTNGTALANIFTALDVGLRTFDTSVGGLGGCPYSPGATGNVATEDVVYALTGESFFGDIGEPYPGEPPSIQGPKWDVGPISLPLLVETGAWISEMLGRPNASLAGRAYLARKRREQELAEKAQASSKH